MNFSSNKSRRLFLLASVIEALLFCAPWVNIPYLRVLGFVVDARRLAYSVPDLFYEIAQISSYASELHIDSVYMQLFYAAVAIFLIWAAVLVYFVYAFVQVYRGKKRTVDMYSAAAAVAVFAVFPICTTLMLPLLEEGQHISATPWLWLVFVGATAFEVYAAFQKEASLPDGTVHSVRAAKDGRYLSRGVLSVRQRNAA